jgi:hypothetical protein
MAQNFRLLSEQIIGYLPSSSSFRKKNFGLFFYFVWKICFNIKIIRSSDFDFDSNIGKNFDLFRFRLQALINTWRAKGDPSGSGGGI